MRVSRHASQVSPAARPRVVAAGRFDGLHRGHQRLLARVVERARSTDGEAMVLVARGRDDAPRLIDLRQQIERLDAAGIAHIVFVSAAALEAAVAQVGAQVRVTALGRGVRAPRGGTLDEIAPVEECGVAIGAAAIRTAVARGDLQTARTLLGRDPSVGGRVVHGFHRGAALGIPTANLRVRGIQLPPDGVYAVWASGGGERLRGVANIGFNPTFGNRTRTLETHLLDFTGDLYGRRLEIAFLARLRGEQKFPDVAALLAQIRHDISAARRLFERHG